MSKVRWGLAFIAVICIAMMVVGLIFPDFFNNLYYFSGMLIIFTILGILSSFSLQFKNLKIITTIIFIIAAVTVFLWFFIIEFSVIFFFQICNLCYVFVYALFFTLMHNYAFRYHEKYEDSAIKGYHIHENFYGILFIISGLVMILSIWWKTGVFLLDFLKYHTFLYLGTAFIIVGAFLLGRDFNDFKNFRFIEKKETRIKDPNFHIREKYYHMGKFGIVFTLFGIIFLFQHPIWGTLFLDRLYFIIFGFILTILGAFLSGLNPTFFTKKTTIGYDLI